MFLFFVMIYIFNIFFLPLLQLYYLALIVGSLFLMSLIHSILFSAILRSKVNSLLSASIQSLHLLLDLLCFLLLSTSISMICLFQLFSTYIVSSLTSLAFSCHTGFLIYHVGSIISLVSS